MHYVNGFGEVDGNFWLGLEEIHQVTTTHNVSLYTNIETFEGEAFTMKLQIFSVNDATTNYAWNFSGFSQSYDRVKGSVLGSWHNAMMFTTRDRDNDLWSTGNSRRRGWWYNSCGLMNLNGNYEDDVTPTYTGITMQHIDASNAGAAASKAVETIEMIIRTRVE